ncbi:Bgt-4053 [Blumeria graminis f. sp. tritici]|uniref:HECT-type E3 ubiquitin transferase n=3 Tax=Blumeria graminis f. sp. tritici TaxID=62690 RepID=A0A9X9QE65_BLUGR|nr:Bgt-4053 [Blumeria graminis f. sp. tritici]
MFQTFSGSSRRPRQVNLSGQNLNPFATTPTPWATPVSGSQIIVANAQQKRLKRQQERERLRSAIRIQRVWRGYRSRREMEDLRRKEWDDLELNQGGLDLESRLLAQIKLLVSFYRQTRKDDLERIKRLSSNVVTSGLATCMTADRADHLILPLAFILVEALNTSLPEYQHDLFQLLISILEHRPSIFTRILQEFFTLLSAMSKDRLFIDNTSSFQTALKLALTQCSNLEDNCMMKIYESFAVYYLTTPELPSLINRFDEISSFIDINLLSTTLAYLFSTGNASTVDDEGKIWLLAYFISFNRFHKQTTNNQKFLRALSVQLSESFDEIICRIDHQNDDILNELRYTDDNAKHAKPLPEFILDELNSLITQESVTALITNLEIDHLTSSQITGKRLHLTTNYALTLLRIFPRRGDEIRMWLYLASVTTPNGDSVPTSSFLWHATRATYMFSAISFESRTALPILRCAIQENSEVSKDHSEDQDLSIILLFLEIYLFTLRFIDDEEFLSLNVPHMDLGSNTVSRPRQCALSINDLKNLTSFLKNLAFAIYYQGHELLDDSASLNENCVGTFFGNHTAVSNHQLKYPGLAGNNASSRPFYGILGVSINYVKVIVTRTMHTIYERDSRRNFLPKDHWLMTAQFEMGGFIPAVVVEEERLHDLSGDSDDGMESNENLNFFESRSTSQFIGTIRPRQALQDENLRGVPHSIIQPKFTAGVGPRLNVLQNMPFVIPFETRVKIFRQFVLLDQTRRRGGYVDPDIWRVSILQHPLNQRNNTSSSHDILGRHHAKIRRSNVFEDAYHQFYGLGEGIKEPIQITFVDQFDAAEAGIDGGGVTKEFLTSISNEAFCLKNDPKLFITNDQNLLYPNPSVLDEERESLRLEGYQESSLHWKVRIIEILRQFVFLGRIVGKCLYEGILIDIEFAGFFLLKWATSGLMGSDFGYRANIDHLRDLDESLHQGLLKLKNYHGNVEDFFLDFTITDSITLKNGVNKTITRELIPNGSQVPVNNENRPLYVSYVARHRLQIQPHQQTQAFLKGLTDVINPTWISMFNQSELQRLVSGDSSEIDIDDLRRNTVYSGAYQIGDDGEEHDTIKIFWKVFKSLDDSDRRKVLKYVTSTPRAPLLGFSQLNPLFTIRDSGNDEERLPSTSTCVNLLKLPRYANECNLKEKLLYAVHSGAGFDLS